MLLKSLEMFFHRIWKLIPDATQMTQLEKRQTYDPENFSLRDNKQKLCLQGFCFHWSGVGSGIQAPTFVKKLPR